MTPIPIEALLRRLLYRGLKTSSHMPEYRARSQHTLRTKFNWRIRLPKGNRR